VAERAVQCGRIATVTRYTACQSVSRVVAVRSREGLGRMRGHEARPEQRGQRLEQRRRQRGPATPLPARTLRRFQDAWLPGVAVRHDEERDVVRAVRGEDITGVRAKGDGLELQPRFFPDLADGTVLHGLPELEMPAWEGPRARTMRAHALAQQDEAVPEHDDPDTDTGSPVFHGGLRPHHCCTDPFALSICDAWSVRAVVPVVSAPPTEVLRSTRYHNIVSPDSGGGVCCKTGQKKSNCLLLKMTLERWRGFPPFPFPQTLDKMMPDRKHLVFAEVERLLAAAKGSRNAARDRCLLLLMFRHGLRVSVAYRRRAVNASGFVQAALSSAPTVRQSQGVEGVGQHRIRLLRCHFLNQWQLDELYAVLRAGKDGALSEDDALPRLERSPRWAWTARDPESTLLLAIDVRDRTLAMAQRLVHQVVQVLGPGCVPLFLTEAVYLLAADKYVRLIASRLSGVNQPVIDLPDGLSTPPLAPVGWPLSTPRALTMGKQCTKSA
jgi:hypothetical protein